MIERAYQTMGKSGTLNVVVGIIVIVTGVTAGVLIIVGGARLLCRRKGLTF